MKYTLGYIFMLAGSAISWRSIKQTIMALSTMHVNYIVCYEGTSQVSWLRNFTISLKVIDSISRPIKECCEIMRLFYTPS